MKSSDKSKGYKKMIHDIAEAVSSNVDSANEYMEEEGIDFSSLISSGMKSIQQIPKSNTNLSNQQIYFRRVVLAGEIARNLCGEYTFGHVKFMKLMYLSEKICEYNLNMRYSKQAAGPMDHKFIHSIDREFKKQNWFEVTKEGPYNKYVYRPLPGLSRQGEYYANYYSKHDEKIQWLLNTFRSSKTERVELIATIFACWEELIAENSIISDESLIEKVYKWSKEKKKFSRDKIIEGIRWMEANNLYPSLA